ncbi:MAG: NAD-dependent epimerase/dehydratase family protein [Acidobacteriota bacterium]|nr:NAD-dependent epimerase/dehydratase family protein [Acidobacteriota bacterium]
MKIDRIGSMKVLVTGGSGFLGTQVRRFFAADDFSRRSGFDVLNLNDAQAVSDYDVVIHLAAYLDKSPEAAEQCFLVNVEGTVNLLRAMSPNSVFIFASTKDVYGHFAEDYDEVPENCRTDFHGQNALEWSKLIAEKYVEFYAHERNFRSCIFRLSTVYAPLSEGNEPNFVTFYAEAVKFGAPVRLPLEGKPVRDILNVEDFARACRAFVDSEIVHGFYNLGGGRDNALSLRDLLTRFEEIMGAQAVISDEMLPAPVPLNYVTDLTKIKDELNWQPQVPLEAGLRSLL